MATHPFDRVGLATLSDLETPYWRELFTLLENDQAKFLEKESLFRSSAYAWTRDPLHNWSRAWEYPYAYHHIKTWMAKKLSNSKTPRVADIGSGVTFFPFSVARLGCHVTSTDIDPVCEIDLNRAIQCVPHVPGQVDFRRTDGQALPFADSELDIVYCISVLEHIPSFIQTLSEMVRIIRPSGLLLLTVDLAMYGNLALSIDAHKTLFHALSRHFTYVYPDASIHPADMLHSANGKYFAPQRFGGFARASHITVQLLKNLLGRKVAVQGFVLQKIS